MEMDQRLLLLEELGGIEDSNFVVFCCISSHASFMIKNMVQFSKDFPACTMQRRMWGAAMTPRSQWKVMRSWRLSPIQAGDVVAMFCGAPKFRSKRHVILGFSGHLQSCFKTFILR